jgi:hypothetical protein
VDRSRPSRVSVYARGYNSLAEVDGMKPTDPRHFPPELVS